MTEGLLPCWICHAQDAQISTIKGNYYVSCPYCYTTTPLYKSSLAAAKSWNDTYLEQKYKREEGKEAINAPQQG